MGKLQQFLADRMSPFGRQVFNMLAMDPESFIYNDFYRDTLPVIDHERLGEFMFTTTYIVGVPVWWGMRHKGSPDKRAVPGTLIDRSNIVSTRRLRLADQLVLRRAFGAWMERTIDLNRKQEANTYTGANAAMAAPQQPKPQTATAIAAQQQQWLNRGLADLRNNPLLGIASPQYDHAADTFTFTLQNGRKNTMRRTEFMSHVADIAKELSVPPSKVLEELTGKI